MTKSKINIFWFRRDLRLNDNTGLFHALTDELPVLPIFIFDPNILDKLEKPNDLRVQFIFQKLDELNKILLPLKKSIQIFYGEPLSVLDSLLKKYDICKVYTNMDYEPYARKRDKNILNLLLKNDASLKFYKDQVIFKTDDILKKDNTPYTVFTPYRRKWQERFTEQLVAEKPSQNHLEKFISIAPSALTLSDIGFKHKSFSYPPQTPDFSIIAEYDKIRDFPALNSATRLGIHLRFGTVSIRNLVKIGYAENETWLSELIWREFFMMILWHFPQVVRKSFKEKYQDIPWTNNRAHFEKWCAGKTGYPLVDAGMRELVSTGNMHNRARMICAGFLTKHLLIDWRWGEAFFAKHLLDFELSSNNGNWQWAAGCGCDAAPYFRIFNPITQQQKFDADFKYIRKFVEEFDSESYPKPMIDHKFARTRAIETYRESLTS